MFSRQVLRSVRAAAAPSRAFAVGAVPARTFAAAASADVKPPVAVFGVDGTYATALVKMPSPDDQLLHQFFDWPTAAPWGALGFVFETSIGVSLDALMLAPWSGQWNIPASTTFQFFPLNPMADM